MEGHHGYCGEVAAALHHPIKAARRIIVWRRDGPDAASVIAESRRSALQARNA
jgi:hypothetical protein